MSHGQKQGSAGILGKGPSTVVEIGRKRNMEVWVKGAQDFILEPKANEEKKGLEPFC